MLCEKHPDFPKCMGKRPPAQSALDIEKKRFQMAMLVALYSCIGLMVFVVLYRNLCSGDAMDDLNQSVQRGRPPADAVDADEFLALAGFDRDEVFSKDNPNPIVVAQAQMSLEKMLKQMKAAP